MALIKKKKSRRREAAALNKLFPDNLGQTRGFRNSKRAVAMLRKQSLQNAVEQAGGRLNKIKIVVAMSGGVDSSVAAALLKKEGHEVIGFFMKLWSPQENPAEKARIENSCCSLEAENRARKVAKILKIPFYVFDFEEEFKKRIVDSFLKECGRGLTPNPCVVCNKKIKFGLLLEKALKLNVDLIATGHYARIRPETLNCRPGLGLGSKRAEPEAQSHTYKLLKGKDKDKDQSYFLWQLSQKQLGKVSFPVGDYTRKEVENLARKFKLPFSGVKKSQEICFVPKTVEDFLKKYLKPKPGPICLEPGSKQVGEHQGLYFYTIGQRKGIKLPGGPYYVLEKDLKNNFLIVTKKEKDLFKKETLLKNVNWISGKEPVFPLRVKVKIRYRHQLSTAAITKDLKSKNYNLKFSQPQRAITSGQSAVFYRGQELLGGGIIC